MTLRMFPLAVLLAGAVLVTAHAQQPAANSLSKGGPGQTAPTIEKAADPLAEEIEIMRRLLDRTLEKQQRGQVVGTPSVITNFPPNNLWDHNYPPIPSSG